MTPRRVIRTAAARADIDKITDWLFERSGSVDVVMKWLRELDSRIEAIAAAPGTGTSRPELGAGMRSSPFGNYLIFFRSTSRILRIRRVLHAARDFSRGWPAD